MPITVSIPTILRTYTSGEKIVDACGVTLREVIADLDANYRGISARLLDGGQINRFVLIFVDDEDVRFSGGLDTAVSDVSEVAILSAVAGGAVDVRNLADSLPAHLQGATREDER